MHNGKCGCTCSKIGKYLLIAGGFNWGLMGLTMLMGSGEYNLIRMSIGSWPTLEAVVYVLVGVAAVMKIFGCRCKKCMDGCASHESGSMDRKM